MFRLSVESLRARPARFVATMLAIVLATGFLAGALVLQDSLGEALELNATSQLDGVDAAVQGSGEAFVGFGDVDSVGGVAPALLEEVRAIDEVGEAAGTLVGAADLLGDEEVLVEGLEARAWVDVEALNPYTLVDGEAPTSDDEVVLDERTVQREELSLGDELGIATPDGAQQVRLVGVTTFGDRPASSGTGDLAFTADRALALFAVDEPRYDDVRVVAADGVEPDELTAALSAAFGSDEDLSVVSGDQLREDEAGVAGGIATAIGIGLQAFAYLALIVGALIIYNTFAAIVGQRTREFALLRAVGASPRQVRRAIRYEAAAIGLVASLLGLGLGVLLYLGLAGSVEAYRDFVGTGRETLVVSPRAVAQVMLTGVVVAVVSALLPAMRAGRTRPVEAMTLSAVDDGATSRVRTVFGTILLVGGVVGLLAGTGGAPAWVAAVGAAALFLGAVVGGPVIAGLVGRLLVRVTSGAGTTSRLSVANAARNPTRTAATANALVVGVSLVVFTTAAGQSVRDWVGDQVASLSGADLQVVETLPDGIAPGLADDLRGVEGVSGVTPTFANLAFVDDDGVPVGAAELAALVDVLGAEARDGSVDDLGPGDAIVVDFYADQPDGAAVEVGDELAATVNGSDVPVTLTVAAIVPFSIDYPGPIMADVGTFAGDAAPPGGLRPNGLLLGVEEDVDRVVRRVEDVTFGYSGVAVVVGNQLADIIRGVFDVIITGINALLGVAVVIALFGIVNTLVLAIIERTREIGVLRAVGMTREQLRTTVRGEAVIVSVMGTMIGIVYGLFGAWAVTRPLFREVDGSMTWPLLEIAAIVVLGVVLGVVSSLVPAWRAARLDVLDAIRTA